MKNWMTFVLLGLLMMVAGGAAAQAPAAGSVAVTVKNVGAGSTIYWIGPGSPPVLQGIAAGGSPAMFSLGACFSIVDGALTYSGGVSDGDKGDITVSGSGATWTIDNGVVTFAKMQDISTAKLLGRATAGTGDVEEIGLGSGLGFSGGNLGLTNTGVTAASYTAANITVDAQGRITAASDGLPAEPVSGDRYALQLIRGSGYNWATLEGYDIFDFVTYRGVLSSNRVGIILPAYDLSSPGLTEFWASDHDGLVQIQTGTVSGTLLTTAGNGGSLTNLNTYALQQVSATDGQVLTWSAANSRWQPGTVSGTGTVTSVAISGTDGIEVDSGSPITTSGTIQLGVNAATLKTTLDLAGSNSGDVTLAGTPDYITISGQTITRGLVDLGTDVTGTLGIGNGGTGASLTDPNADRILFWDDSAGAVTWLTAGTGLTITDTTITASGGGGGVTYKQVQSQVDITDNATLQNITGLSFTAAANTSYKITFHLFVSASATSTGYEVGITGPASPTGYASIATLWNSATAETGTITNSTSYGSIGSNGNSGGSTARPCEGTILFHNGSNSGTVQLQGKVETGVSGTVSFKTGGFMFIEEVTTP